MRQGLLFFFLAALTCTAQNVNDSQSASFDPKPWLEDFHQILSEMSVHYANLDWAVEDRKMDLPRLRLDTESKLREATNEQDARRILDKFLASFGDGHLQIDWPKNPGPSKPAAAVPQTLCDRLGYNMRLRPGLDFASLPGFSALNTPEGKFFSGGLLRLPNRTTLGIIRIALFSEHGYPEICQEAVRNLHLEESAACDEKCEDQLELATGNLLTAALVRRAEALAAAGATTLLIDITHNGGGSDWAEVPPRVLTSVPLHDPKAAFIRHEHWTKQLQERLQTVEADIKNHAGPAAPLETEAAALEKAIEESKRPCNRAAVWDTGKLACSLLVPTPAQTKRVSLYTYTENPKAQPLYVAVDRDTWSAAEYFAAILQDNHAATIFGEVTGGAGCGYTNGGIPAKLKNSGAPLKMPDCVRFRADGTNEVNGVIPDVLLPWSGHDSDFQRAKKMLAALESR
jgi:hypothetical protein